MRYNLNYLLASPSGVAVLGPSGEQLTLRAAIHFALETQPVDRDNSGGFHPRPPTMDEITRRLAVGAKLAGAQTEAELTAEEISLIKDAARSGMNMTALLALAGALEQPQAI